ncbi:histidine phosphatase family protein [Nodosilinea sp. LEGE 07088]|uniref:histidine phosphatase family protein n=1 Tax=Nodosilinea sp. LEGE 07088 TaxID=2777968 RepID=UPI0018812D96|nr:histidine phosphatase family protein [Nodosilinea sp. LEGE 07088]MBE9139998.1 histidine phosphatase family protein [Nodosilinea sp. LEGE 07088]
MPLNLYFLRHGETESSQTGTYCGFSNPGLTASGTAMAQAFADKYQRLPWQAVYASPLRRTVETATPFCQATGQTMAQRDGLKEMFFGEWEGLTHDEVETRYSGDYVRWLTEPAWNPPTGGETGVQVASRAALVIAEIEANHSSGNVLIVSHKTTIRLLLCNLLGIDSGRYRDRIELPVASVSLVRFGDHGPRLAKHGDRSHLPEELDSRPGT